MATRGARCGIDHPTVVPENFDPDEDTERSGDPTDETPSTAGGRAE